MLVVSDSSPLNFLVRLDCVDVLPKLFGTVLIPSTVAEELMHPGAPDNVKSFLASPPDWLQVRSPAHLVAIPKLDPGEQAAICLAEEVRADAVLLDDRDARIAAARRGLVVVGLLGILEKADERGFIDLSEVAARFPSDYRIDRAIVEAVLHRRKLRSKPQ